MTVKNRFEVSTEGMKMLQDGRPLWQLVKELISNAWDEEITSCDVSIKSVGKGTLLIEVEDDGKGFRDITDAYTIFAPTPKRGQASVRGRFNLGEKELLAIAKDGIVETVGHTVEFPSSGGKKVKRNVRINGTKVSVTLKGRLDSIEPTIEKIKTFIPPKGIRYVINGVLVRERSTIATTEAVLPTVLAEKDQVLRPTNRKTSIDIYNSFLDSGHIYEMGIPIQSIAMPYDVDIQQKVPLPPNRDIVSDAYLRHVYAEVLKVVRKDIDDEDAGSSWITMAVEDKRTDDDTVRDIMLKRLGNKTVIRDPFDAQANADALDGGWETINPKTLTPTERQRYKDAGLLTANQKFGRFKGGHGLSEPMKHSKVTPPMLEVARYTKWLSKQLLGFEVKVQFISDFRFKMAADYNKGSKTLRFGKIKLGSEWFDNSPTQKQTALIIHELAHEHGGSGCGIGEGNPHGWNYIYSLEALGAKATHLAIKLKGEWWFPGSDDDIEIDSRYGNDLVTEEVHFFDKFFPL